jgi:hypothetical protein
VATNRTRDSLASSNDTKPIQTNNLVPTPQPMTATLIFRRQLVRHKPDLLTASSTADKLPLEKFHRLLDLVFWGKFLKFGSISCFVFLWVVNRVSLDPVILSGACGAPLTRPGGRATLSCPPGPRLAIAKFWYCIHCLQLSYSVLHCYPRLALDTRLFNVDKA